MNCERVRSLLGAYVDGELDLVTALEIEEHLRGCESCRREYRLLMDLHEATRAPSLQYSAPPRLESRIRASLKKSSPRSPTFPVFSWRSLASASAAVLVLFAIVAILA